MSKVLNKKIRSVEKLEELENGFDLVRITVEGAAKFIFREEAYARN
mgnify:CR=1 FL=1